MKKVKIDFSKLNKTKYGKAMVVSGFTEDGLYVKGFVDATEDNIYTLELNKDVEREFNEDESTKSVFKKKNIQDEFTGEVVISYNLSKEQLKSFGFTTAQVLSLQEIKLKKLEEFLKD